MQCSLRLTARCGLHYVPPLPYRDRPHWSVRHAERIQYAGARKFIGRRHLALSSIPAVLLPPVVFSGLLITLWTYKCLMMIVFQNKIIYMPSMPPFSRSEKVEDYHDHFKPVMWSEHAIRSLDGTQLKLLEGTISKLDNAGPASKHVVVVYFQGNGSSLPPRLPYLSNILKLLHKSVSDVQYTVVALSYRGFWKSKGRPSQQGIELDAQAALKWVEERCLSMPNTKVVLWGQSIGAGVATTALARWLQQTREDGLIAGLLLETPFTSLRAMLISLYPQKFLPYRYLGPFLTSSWDSIIALQCIGQALGHEVNRRDRLRVLLLEAGNDELVPRGDAGRLYDICKTYDSLYVEHRTVAGALHTDVMMKSEGKTRIASFLKEVGQA